MSLTSNLPMHFFFSFSFLFAFESFSFPAIQRTDVEYELGEDRPSLRQVGKQDPPWNRGILAGVEMGQLRPKAQSGSSGMLV